MGIIAGGVVIQEGVARPVNPFGRFREVRAGDTIQTAIDAAESGDVIYIEANGDDTAFEEALTITKSNLTLVGIGGRGSVSIAPGGNGVALTIDGSAARRTDITLINLGLEGAGTGGGLHVKGNVRRVRAYGCKIEGGANALRLESTAAGAISDSLFQDCEICWSTDLVSIEATGGGDPVTQTRIKSCHLHNMSARGIHVDTVHTTDLWIDDCTVAGEEDGTLPTDELVKADVASTTGMISNCRFAIPTNAAADLAIAAGVLWVANMTEAGVSSARPA